MAGILGPIFGSTFLGPKSQGPKFLKVCSTRDAIAIHSKSWIPWIPESADNIEFSAEGLSENAKTISQSNRKLTILQCATNKGQEVLKSSAEKPQISD